MILGWWPRTGRSSLQQWTTSSRHTDNMQSDIVALHQHHRIPRKPVTSTAVYQPVPTKEDVRTPRVFTVACSSTYGRPSVRLSFLKVWWQEILACVLTIASFVALIVTLLFVHGKTLPQLPLHVSVNTLVAILATILKGAASFVLAEGLGQLKWSWYRKPRKLRDFQVYDDASRGPWGALQFSGIAVVYLWQLL